MRLVRVPLPLLLSGGIDEIDNDQKNQKNRKKPKKNQKNKGSHASDERSDIIRSTGPAGGAGRLFGSTCRDEKRSNVRESRNWLG